MNVRYLNPFISSICNVFETMCGLKVTIGKPSLQTETYERTDVSAIIGFSGDAAGSVTLCFGFDTAATVATAFAGTEISPEHEDFGDALGELANMVAGGAKAKLEGLDVNISLPSVVIGRGQRIVASKSNPRLHIPCSTGAGNFRVEVGMEICKKRGVTTKAATAGANA